MNSEPDPSQRDLMRSLFQFFGDDEDRVCEAYAEAEEAGEVRRYKNENHLTALEYARALWKDGKRVIPPKEAGWLHDRVPVRAIRLMWVKTGLQPLTSFGEGEYFYSLRDAAAAALKDQGKKRIEGLAPWIRAGTGKGAYVLNVQGIMLLLAAYEEGAGQ